MTDETASSAKPPYLSFVTFKNFISNLKKGVIPTRIDKHAMPGFSGGTISYMLAALRFFKLIDERGAPQDSLHSLVEGDEADQTAAWKKLFDEGYGSIIDGLNLERAGVGELQERFGARGFTGETLRKCQSFFTAVAEMAGVALAPHLKSNARSSTGPRKRRARTNGSGTQNDPPPPPAPALPAQTSKKTMDEMLLEKFPSFDPAWPDDLKAKWFSGFDMLMTKAKGAESTN